MEWRFSRKCLSAFAWVLAVGAAVQAGTIHVGMESSAEHHSLKSAVAAAQSGDTIVLSEGHYNSDGFRDVTIRDKAITIRGRDPNDPTVVAKTILDCRGGESQNHRAFEVVPGQSTRLEIMGLTIVNGYYSMSGGVVLCEGAEFRAYNCTFSDSRVQWWGGVLHLRDSQVRLDGCTFSNNVSDGSHGAAIFCAACAIELDNCAFLANSGGAIESYDSDLTLTQCVFQENTGQAGAAINSRVDANPESPSRLNLSRCTFVGNAAQTQGGALYSYEVNAVVDDCTFTANTAGTDGGAILNHRSNPVLTDCVFAGNKAQGLGGAAMSLFGSSPQIIHCTLVANRASRGGALACKGQGRTSISHSILWDNAAERGQSLYLARYEWSGVQTAAAAVEYSDVDGGQSSVSAESGCSLTWSAGNLDADPLFTGPAHDDYRLSPDSPCIDAGDPRYTAASDAEDLDNYSRQFGSAVDLGAYEYRGLGAVYHFRSPAGDRDFYTISGAERDRLLAEFPAVWIYENVAYYAFYEPIVEYLRPVYRFWSPILKSHVWTILEEEREDLVQKHADAWIF
ncbi:MAG: right-handed parallel beta-helix repeat-containing protein, partial [Phycisphaerales bacterium]